MGTSVLRPFQAFLCSFIVESSSGGKEVYNIPVLEFKTGKMTQQTKLGNMPQTQRSMWNCWSRALLKIPNFSSRDLGLNRLLTIFKYFTDVR